ncbi:MAG: DUF2384 domain-containing protein [Bryobacterales bacterium]|nr:DUF2384 domain-containing protein [Bryobacterales bacterium]
MGPARTVGPDFRGSQALPRRWAQRWLERPNRALGSRTPLSMLDTKVGAETVETVLGRIA